MPQAAADFRPPLEAAGDTKAAPLLFDDAADAQQGELGVELSLEKLVPSESLVD